MQVQEILWGGDLCKLPRVVGWVDYHSWRGRKVLEAITQALVESIAGQGEIRTAFDSKYANKR